MGVTYVDEDANAVAWVPYSAGPETITTAPGMRSVYIGDVLVTSYGFATAPLQVDALVTATYNGDLARVQLVATGLTGFTTVRFERSTDGVTWVTVRGGASVSVSPAGVATLDDYEFTDGIVQYYRVVTTSPIAQPSAPATITTDIGCVWIKSVARPFLNRMVAVIDWSDETRDARSGVFDVVGASAPIVVYDRRRSVSFDLKVRTTTETDSSNLNALVDAGDVLFVHIPFGSMVPGGYVTVGTTGKARPVPTRQTRVWTLPCQVVRKPSPDVVGATVTWRIIKATYATWRALKLAQASWGTTQSLVGTADDVVVG